MFPEWTWIVGFYLGATVGSFLNVVIYRLPRGISLAKPSSSFCPICKHPLASKDLLPLFSWLWTRAKCRYCAAKIPARYFWVEVVTGALWAGIWWKFFVAGGFQPDWITGCFYLAAASTLVSIIYIDWELYIIPDQINAFLLVIAFGLAVVKGHWSLFFWGWFVGWGILWGIAFLGRLLFGKDAMGHGDIKMMRGLGALLGPGLIVANVGFAVVVGLIVGLTGMAMAALKKSPPEKIVEGEDEEFQGPEPIKDLVVLGGTYLLALDIPAIWMPQMYTKMGYQMEPENIEEDDWTPTATTIPFGPYLAAGALVCMLFSDVVYKGWDRYIDGLSGPVAIERTFDQKKSVFQPQQDKLVNGWMDPKRGSKEEGVRPAVYQVSRKLGTQPGGGESHVVVEENL